MLQVEIKPLDADEEEGRMTVARLEQDAVGRTFNKDHGQESSR
jgi:hypothetical protein